MATVKVLQIAASKPYAARFLYHAAWHVFLSLPPLMLLEEYEKERYNTWYQANFTDTADGWNSGASLLMSDNAQVFSLKTPTSGRIIQGEIDQHTLRSCIVRFPTGSVQAASEILLRMLPPQTCVHQNINTYDITVSVINEAGKIQHCSVDEIRIDDLDVTYSSSEVTYRLHVTAQ